MKILGVDCGDTTGGAYWDGERIAQTWEIPGCMPGLCDWLIGLDVHPDLVIAESFIVNAQTHKLTRRPTAFYGIGAVQLWAALHGAQFAEINAGGHKPFSGVKLPMAKSKIIRLGWCKRTKDRHAEDACSLVLWGLKKNDRPTFAALMREIGVPV